MTTTPHDHNRLRLDRWLWAARFFKTRALAAAAVRGGKVQLNATRAKPGKSVAIGDVLTLRLGPYQRVVTVRALQAQRGSAAMAVGLYEEHPESIATREALSAQLKLDSQSISLEPGRPTKRNRRNLIDFKKGSSN